MVSNGRLSRCDDANEWWPGGCQSCVSTTWRKRPARRLMVGTTSSPCGTGSLPLGQKSFWTSTTNRTSLSPIVIAMVAYPTAPSRDGRANKPRCGSSLRVLLRHASIDFGRKPPQRLAHLHRVRRAGLEPAQRLGQALKITRGSRPNFGKQRRRRNTLAALHDQFDERLACLIIVLQRQDVAGHAPVGPEAAPDLLAAGPGRLAGGALAPRQPGILLELVGAIEPRCVIRGGQAAADAEAVDRRTRSDDVRDHRLVDAAAGEDGHVAQPALVEDTPHRLGQGDQVAAVETHAPDRDARSLEPGSERDHLPRRRLAVVGVDEQGQVLGPRASEVLECFDLVIVHLDVRMRHGPEYRDAKLLVGQDRGGGGEACRLRSGRR